MHYIGSIDPYEFAGMIGFFLYMTNYTLLTTRRLTGNSLVYYLINLGAASLVLLGLSVNFNLPAALIQAFWVCMSIVGIFTCIRRNRRFPG